MAHSKSNSKQIKLYDYQGIAFKKLVAALKKTFRALMVMVTGLGKTIVSIEVVKYFITPKDRVLFLCHDNGILNKTYKDYRKYIGESYTYAKFYGTQKDWEADKHNFVFATFQSVLAHLNNPKAKKKLFSPKHFTFIVVDESHHAQAETYAEVINYFKPKYKLGMTATPDREDGEDIRDIFGEEVVKILLPEAIAKGWLTPVEYKLLSDGLDEEKIRQICKDVLDDNVRMTEKQINEKIFIKVRSQEQCKIIQQYSKTRKAIVFCENIQHAQHISFLLPSSVSIHSQQATGVNDANYELFETGAVKHVLVVDKFNEGIDIPDTELLSFLRRTESERIFYQQLGRGLRKVPGKEKVVVLDFVGNIERIKQVAKLALEIETIAGIERKKNGTPNMSPLHVEGKGFSFDFSDQVVNLFSVFERLGQDFYPTWQEASEAAVKLGIKNYTDYKNRFKEDPRLPGNPNRTYKNFPKWYIFLGRKPKNFYKSWKLASKAAIKLGIKTFDQYKIDFKKDPKLPSRPETVYSDFPGYVVFLGKARYKNWKEASKACKTLGINSITSYKQSYKKDPGLVYDPRRIYPDFPGWTKFLGKE